MSTQYVPKGHKFDFTFHHAASPFTASQQAYLKSHPDARYEYIATGALVFDTTDQSVPRIILLQRLPHSAGDSMPDQWEVPGGGCEDDDESILHSVARELWEEAGLEARYIGAPAGNPQLFTSRSGKKVCKFNFVVETEKVAGQQPAPTLDPKEHQQFVWASEFEVRAKKARGFDLCFTSEELVNTILQAFDQLKER